jgi:hypothetical protein
MGMKRMIVLPARVLAISLSLPISIAASVVAHAQAVFVAPGRASVQEPTVRVQPANGQTPRMGRGGLGALFGGNSGGGAQFAETLTKTVWNAQERGPLLIVLIPENDGIDTNAKLAENAKNYNLGEVSQAFKRGIARVGTLTALVPKENKESPSLLAMMDMGLSMLPGNELFLMAELNDTQLAALGSPTGLGMAQLNTPKQRQLFSQLVPKHLTQMPASNANTPGGAAPAARAMPREWDVTPVEQQGMRLRLIRTIKPQLRMSLDASAFAGVPNADQIPKEMSMPMEMMNPDSMSGRVMAMPGRAMTDSFTNPKSTPNNLKTGQMDFASAALNAPITLTADTTVGELVKKVAAATRVEFYCDPRAASRKVLVRASSNGAAVRSGDVLKALCWSLNGVFRRLEDPQAGRGVFVLTDSITGLAGKENITGAGMKGMMGMMSTREKARLILKNRNAGQHVRPSGTDAFNSDKTLQDKLKGKKASNTMFGGGNVVPIAELNPAQQQLVRAAIQKQVEARGGRGNNNVGGAGGMQFRDDVIGLDSRVSVEWAMVDGTPIYNPVGAFLPFPDIDADAPLPEPLPYAVPASFTKNTALCVRAETVESTQTLVAQAIAHGWKEIWVQGTPEIIKAAIEASKSQIAVRGMVRLLRKDTKEVSESTDISATGERAALLEARDESVLPSLYTQNLPGGDWLTPDSPTMLPSLLSTIKSTATLPGLAGLVFTDIAAPGYYKDSSSGMGGGGNLYEMGYTLDRRLAFLRKTSCDPIDIAPLGGFSNSIALSGDASDVGDDWKKARQSVLTKFHRGLFAALEKDAPRVPIFAQSLGGTSKWFASGWNETQPLPVGVSNPFNPFSPSSGEERKAYKQTFLSVTYLPNMLAEGTLLDSLTGMSPFGGGGGVSNSIPPTPDGPLALARAVKYFVGANKGTWNGLVLDMRGVPTEQIAPMLEGVAVK